MADLKHKTVGVSFHPQLRQRAAERARTLGLSFSRYVALCVESELGEPRPPLPGEASPGALARADLNLEDAIDEGSDYGLAKAQSIRFEEDIEEILTADDFCFERLAHVAHLRTDFLIHDASPEGERTLKVALECKHDLRNRYTVTLGQAIILRSLPGIDAVLLCVPYLRNFDAHILQTYRDQGIPVTTPDTLSTTLGDTFDTLRASQSSSQRPSPPQKPR